MSDDHIVRNVHERAAPVRGLDLGIPDGMARLISALIVGGFLSACLILALTADPDHSARSSTATTPWPGWAILGYVLLACGILLVVGTALYLMIRLYIAAYAAWTNHRHESTANGLKARQIPPDRNGFYPAIVTERGNAIADPNRAPAGIVTGLDTSAPTMPDPSEAGQRTTTQHQAAQFMAAATGEGSFTQAAGRALETLSRPALVPPPMPPRLQPGDDAPDEVRLLLEEAEREWIDHSE